VTVKTVEQSAPEFLDQYGADAVPILREGAELAEDEGAGKAWRDIADAAERLLSE
jgi:hypothetical protein